MTLYDVIVVGGGASGLMCAAVAAQSGKNVLVLEGNQKLGRKILISGGGNCNFTNLEVTPQDYWSKNPHFCKSAITRYTPEIFLDLLESYGVKFYEKKLGQLFCADGAEKILQVLVAECEKAKVTIQTGVEVRTVSKGTGGFSIKAVAKQNEIIFQAKNLVMATGGLSFKGLGATDIGYRVATKFGMAQVQTEPSLVPLLLGGYKQLAGLALPVEMTTKKQTITDDFLFTHLGFSGPAVLKTSLYWQQGEEIKINFMPHKNLGELLQKAKKKGGVKSLSKLLSPHLPAKFIEFWLEKELCPPDKDLQNFTQKELDTAAKILHSWAFIPQGTEGYKKAEVTRGGIDTKEVSSKTMECKSITGLYFIGELLDVTGLLGGYNFHWAWASGWAAGTDLATK